jgi:hypothetical protein
MNHSRPLLIQIAMKFTLRKMFVATALIALACGVASVVPSYTRTIKGHEEVNAEGMVVGYKHWAEWIASKPTARQVLERTVVLVVGLFGLWALMSMRMHKTKRFPHT